MARKRITKNETLEDKCSSISEPVEKVKPVMRTRSKKEATEDNTTTVSEPVEKAKPTRRTRSKMETVEDSSTPISQPEPKVKPARRTRTKKETAEANCTPVTDQTASKVKLESNGIIESESFYQGLYCNRDLSEDDFDAYENEELDDSKYFSQPGYQRNGVYWDYEYDDFDGEDFRDYGDEDDSYKESFIDELDELVDEQEKPKKKQKSKTKSKSTSKKSTRAIASKKTKGASKDSDASSKLVWNGENDWTLKEEGLFPKQTSEAAGNQLTLSFTPKEMQRLKEICGKCGLSLEEYIECCALKIRPVMFFGPNNFEMWKRILNIHEKLEQFETMLSFCTPELQQKIFTSEAIMQHWHELVEEAITQIKVLYRLSGLLSSNMGL